MRTECSFLKCGHWLVRIQQNPESASAGGVKSKQSRGTLTRVSATRRTASMSEPSDVVLAYIDAFYRWNEAGRKKCRSDNSGAILDEVMQEAIHVLAPYFVSGADVRPGSLAYPSQHQPGREVVQSV